MSFHYFSFKFFLNIFLFSFLSGIFLNNILFDYVLSFLFLIFLSITLFNLFLYSVFSKKYLIYLFLIIFGFSFGILVSQNNLNNIQKNIIFISNYDSGFNNDFTFEIKDIYKIGDYDIDYIANLKSINGVSSQNNIFSLIKIAKNYDISPGDLISSRSSLEMIENFGSFDYKNFLLSKGIYFKSYLPFIQNVGYNSSFFMEKISFIREKSLDIIYEIYPKNEAIFLAGILLGARESLPNNIKDSFNNSGLTHFIAVSGFNITILVVFFGFLFKIFPSFIRAILITFFIILFTFLVGDTAPVIRASFMGVIAYYIMLSGRKGDNFSILLFVAFIMSFFSPLILNYDVSFALSFLAVLGILFTQNFWKRVFNFMPEFFAIREAFVLTMSALVFTLPIMFFNFGQISVISPISNVLVSWTIPIAMFFGFISVIFYLLTPFLGYFFGYIAWIFLKWDMLIVEFFGTRSFSVFKYDFGESSFYFQILYFVMIIFLIFYFKIDEKKEKLL